MKGLLLILFCFSVNLPTHSMRVAFFTIAQESTHLKLDINIERVDFLKALSLSQDVSEQSSYQVYLDKHLTVEINGQLFPLRINKVLQKEQHVLLQCKGGIMPQQINQIIIDNTCLIGVEGHSNIVEIRVRDEERDFLMNNERTHIEITF